MAKMSASTIIGLVVSLILVAVLLPIGINQIATATFDASVDPTVITLITVVIPIMAVIGIVLKMIPNSSSD